VDKHSSTLSPPHDGLWDPLAVVPAARRWLWASLAVLICVLQGPKFVSNLRPDRTEGVDFFQDWASARNVLEGAPVYTPQEASVERYLGYRPAKLFTQKNAHPPPSVLLALPFTGLDYPDATLAWNLVSLVALTASLLLVIRTLGFPFSLWSLCPLVTLLLLCNPLLQQVNHGQLSLLLTLLVTGTWVADRSGRPKLAGALLGTAMAIKIFPGFLFLYFVLRRQWQVVAAGATTFVAITVLTLVVLGCLSPTGFDAGFQAYVGFLEEVLPHVAQYRSDWLNASLVGFWSKLFDAGTGWSKDHVQMLRDNPIVARIGIFISVGLVLVFLARVVWRARSRPECDHAFGLSVIAMLLVAPITWDHYFLLLLVSLALTWQDLPTTDLARGVFLVILACLWINPSLLWETFIANTQGAARGEATPVQIVTLLSFQCYALLGLFAFMFRLRLGARRIDSASAKPQAAL